MNSYYFIFEAQPQLENPVIAHVSRAAVHIWVAAAGLEEARERAFEYLEAERWEGAEEKEMTLLTNERIAAMGPEELENFQAAQAEGLHARFYYWHRSE